MKKLARRIRLALCLGAVLALYSGGTAFSAQQPNIIFILADDMGYGDLGCYGAEKIETPNIDRLAKEGILFTDGHCGASTCTPTRYGLMTGRHPWRSWCKYSALSTNAPLLIEEDRVTIASLLKSAGYSTSIVGKWHLGYGHEEGFEKNRGNTPPNNWNTRGSGPNWNGELKPGPVENGFQYSYVIPVANSFPPYVFVENYRVAGLREDSPIGKLESKNYGKMEGGEGARWTDEELIDRFADKLVSQLESLAEKQQPFFLYYTPTQPHIGSRSVKGQAHWPCARFKGTSQAGPYGDVVQELDWSVGEILTTLDRLGLTENTLVIFTSDNGGYTRNFNGHQPCGPILRGGKGDLVEGGHRVPFLAKWPGRIKPGTRSKETISTTDMLATFAAITGKDLPTGAGPDSYNVLSALLGQKLPHPERPVVLSSGGTGAISIRAGKWKLIDGQGNCGYGEFRFKRPHPAPKPGDPPAQLYNLEEDLGESNNLYLKHPEIVHRLKLGLEKIKADEDYNPTALEQPKETLTIEQLNALFPSSKAAKPAASRKPKPKATPTKIGGKIATGKPNVLLIAVDDLNDWVGCLGGHPQTKTPNIDRLSTRGMLFTNAHCQGTMCNPSRISLLWGRRPSSTGFYDNHYHVAKEPAFLKSHVSLPAHFAANSYETLTAGKVFHSGTPRQSQIVGPRLGQWRKGLDQPVHKKPKGWHGTWDFGPQDYDETKFTDYVTASWVAEQLGKKHDKPFFLSAGFYRPHVPFFPPRRVYDTVENVQLPQVKDDDWSDLSDAARKLTLSNPRIPTHKWMRENDRWQQAVHAYLACVRWTDEQIGRVLDALDNGPHARNTIVVLFSDHGYHLGEKQRWSKFSLWERTTHVPLIVSVPDGLKGASDNPVELLSIYPTLIDLCGLPANPRLEGVSLRPLLENPNAPWEHVAISTLGQNNHAVRDQRWRYIRYADGSEELYDHQTDPNEWNNLAAEEPLPSHAEVIARLKEHLPKTNAPQRGTIAQSANESLPVAKVAKTFGAQRDRPKVLATSATAGTKSSANQTDVTSADVIVYGSTPGGFCAAIAAAREGASVILLEPTDHVGAMNTGGLSHCDSNQMVRKTLMGLFDEWHTRVVKDYTDRGLKAPYNPAKKDQSKWTFEPHVAMRVTMQMLDEAGVTVLTQRYLKSVTKDGPRITSLVTKNGTFTARFFVDGTYEGDLMAAAGVDWTIGREGRDEYGESLAGKQYPKKKMNINGFDDEGNLLPLVTTNDAGDKEAGDKNIMTYSFRLCLTTDPKNRVPMPEPDNYDPARFEIIRRYLKAGGSSVGFDAYALPASQIVGIGTLPLPNKKFDGNNSIGRQFSIGLVGGGKDWHSADEAGRKKIWEAHKQYTLEFIHFLTTDPAVPKKTRDRYTKLGLCKDEFASYDHFSPALYVRESRRMKGLYVISQKDILESPEKDDPIAISSFPIDSHDCQRVALKGGGVINEGTIFPVRRIPGQGYAYHVPYRSILPRPEQCDNLLVPVALSCTHVGISSLRIEGAWMVIGQGAGIAAALAADQDVAVQELEYEKLRERLLAQKQVLQLPDMSDPPSASGSIAAKTLPGIVLDDAHAKLTGNWTRSTNFKPYIENGYVFSGEKDPKTKGDGKATATFRFKAPKSGRYQVFMAYSAHETRAKNVPVTFSSGAHSKTIVVDQTAPLPDGKRFRPIDTVDLQADTETVIQITNADTNGFVILDAVQLLYVE